MNRGDISSMKKLFIFTGLNGFLLICILAFKIPKDPYMTIHALTVYTFDRPMWFNFIVGWTGIYWYWLYYLYKYYVRKE